MKTAEDNSVISDPRLLAGLDAYTQDNQFIGRVSGLLPEIPESEIAAELVRADPIDESGRAEGPEHVEINGIGTVIQTYLTVSIPELKVDWKGRRVTVPLTLAQIEAMPRENRERPIV